MAKLCIIAVDTIGVNYPVQEMGPRTVRAALRPYALELGYLVAAWNTLHHNLSALFALILQPKNNETAQAIWRSTENDFAQRKMLRAAIDIDQNISKSKHALSSVQAQEILWLLNQIDETLRHKRNNAIHAPLMIFKGFYDGGRKTWVEAHFNDQNPRAKPLRDKDLIGEFRGYTDHTETLSRYATAIWYAIAAPGKHPWPERPLLPQAHKTKASGRPGRRTPPPHLRGASGGVMA
jgi:hypothetical protein